MVQAGSGRRGTPRSRRPRAPAWAARRRRRPAPAPPVAARQGAVPNGSVSLTRLLSIARLTPAQAVALAADVLTDLEARPTARIAENGLSRESVRLGVDGRAHLVEEPGPAGPAALLDDLAAAALPPGPAGEPPDSGPVATLRRAAAEARRPGRTIASVASTVRHADDGGPAVRAELARLVRVAGGGGLAPLRPARDDSGPAAPHPRRPRRRPRALARAVVARTWMWVVSLVVLGAAILIEIIFLRDDITRDVQAVFEAGRSGAATPTSTRTLPPVVPPAPAAAGSISAVDLRAVQPCTPGADCQVRVQVVLQPRTEARTVTWDFRVLDRCTGAATTVPGGALTVPPDGQRADAVVTVALPPGDALAVLALTGPPSAASAPLEIPADGGCAAPPSGPPR